MFFKDKLRFNFKKKNYTFSCFFPDKVTNQYIAALNKNKFVRYNVKSNISKKDQQIYIKKINSSKNQVIFGLFNKKKLVGTVGSQRQTNKKFYIGIFIFNKKYLRIGLSKIMIKKAAKILQKNCKISFLFANVNKKNIRSHKLFQNLGFKKNITQPKILKGDTIYSIRTVNL